MPDKTVTIDINKKPTKEQIRMIDDASKKSPVFDKDSPDFYKR